MKVVIYLAAALLLFSPVGCVPPSSGAPSANYQRFVPVPPSSDNASWAALFALDTKTGQLCRAYSKQGPWSDLPLCRDLYVNDNPAASVPPDGRPAQ